MHRKKAATAHGNVRKMLYYAMQLLTFLLFKKINCYQVEKKIHSVYILQQDII